MPVSDPRTLDRRSVDRRSVDRGEQEPRPVSFIGAVETTYLPHHRADVTELSQNEEHWRRDLAAMAAAGVTRIRYPMRWHRIESQPGVFDWSQTDRELDDLEEFGIEPIVDLVHHTSYPYWIDDGFRDRRFSLALERYAERVAARYSSIPAYTVFNEPFATLFLAGHEALWPPYDRGLDGFVRVVTSAMPGIAAASRCLAELLPSAEHVWIDTCEHHAGTPGEPSGYAALANDRRHALLDLAIHHDIDESRPFLGAFLRAGGDVLLDSLPIRVDTLGLDYYCHSEWWYDEKGAYSPSPCPNGFAEVAMHYQARYGLPMLLAETNIRGLPTDRVSWLKFMLEQYETAVNRGADLRGFCWFPYADSSDWDSLLARPAGRPDPVGVVGTGIDGERLRSLFTDAWEAAAAGAPSSALPAYDFQSPCDEQLAGILPWLQQWDWQPPPAAGHVPPQRIQRTDDEERT